jgi:hypothetical protein
VSVCYAPGVLKLLAAPATNDRGPRYMERALAAIHQAVGGREPLTLSYAVIDDRVALLVRVADHVEELVTNPIAANYPNCSLTTIAEPDDALPGWQTWSAELELCPELFPILRHAQFEDLLNGIFADPVSGILRSIRPADDLRCRIEMHITPVGAGRRRAARRAIRILDREFFRVHHRLAEYYAEHVTRGAGKVPAWFLGILARQSPHPIRTSLDTSSSRIHDREEHLQAAFDKIGGHLFEAHIRLVARARGDSATALDRLQEMAGAFGAFTQSRLATFRVRHVRKGRPKKFSHRGNLLSHEELSTLFHPPTSTVSAEKMRTTEFMELEPPPTFQSGTEPTAVTLGRVLFRNDERLIGIESDARRRHVYVVGSTGAGKSTLLLNLIRQDMEAGRGLTVMDVHGDLADAVVRLVPKHRTNDAVVFEAAAEQVIPFNPLACPDPARIDQVTSGVVSAFKKLYDSWGPRLENLLRYAVFATVEQGGTLHDMLRLLTDKAYRDQMVLRISDEVVRSFWSNEFASWNVQYRTEAVSSVTNKLMPFLTSRQLRAITTGTGKQSLDLRRVMDEQRILIINLSRGRLGQDN